MCEELERYAENTTTQACLPLVDAMLAYKNDKVYPLHTPGHKGGRGMEAALRDELGASVLMDVSLMSELDDIHEPETYIKAAQDLAAAAYGSDACFWAVNGTSQAIHAMLMIALKPGEKLLLPRNAHRSVAGGLILGGIAVKYLEPEFDEEFGLQLQVTPSAVEAALATDSTIKAVLLTSPNYYGMAADVRVIADICHAHGAVLLVDEAHGPHLGFSEALPPSALQCGADACAQSTHKILGAMTQCSMLHVQGERLDLTRAADVMSILTTTSPNYLLMGSLDAARKQIATCGEQMSLCALKAASAMRTMISKFATQGVKLLTAEKVASLGLRLDETKVAMNVAACGYTGIEVGDMLRAERIAVELVDAENVLFLVTYADDNEEFYASVLPRIEQVLLRITQAIMPLKKRIARPQLPQAQPKLLLRDVFYGAKESVALTEAVGRVCAEQVSFYPPGIPVLLPGEVIDEDIIKYCQEMKALGLPVSGPADSKLEYIRVLKPLSQLR